MIIKNCQQCNNQIKNYSSKIGKYCSRKCYWESLISRKLSENHKRKIGESLVGNPIYKSKTRNKNISASKQENKNYNWKGNNVGYSSLHKWVNKKLGKPVVCEHCKKKGLKGKQIHWANKSGKYKREINDWLRLCPKCHYKYDSDKIDNGKFIETKLKLKKI